MFESFPEFWEGGWTGSQLYLQTEDNNMGRCAIEGWITKDVATALFEKAGQSDYDFTAAARSRDFKAFSMGMSASISLSNTYKSSTSKNVAALYRGQTEEMIIYSAHWDHLGIGTPVDGDSIWNGAVDNATGTACLLEIANAFQQLPEKPNRSILFLAVTAEEQGLLGSAYYGENPIYPPANTVANINMDALLPFGKMKDVIVKGYGQSEMDDLATSIAEQQGRTIVPDQNPGAGSYFRSDHFSFAKIGIPALYADGGIDHFEKGKDWGKEQVADYNTNRYHKAADEYDESWDLSGMVEDARFFFNVGYTLSAGSEWPNWKEGSEFKAIRDASRGSQ